MKHNVIVYDWEFDVDRLCEDCGKRPSDYWNMARIEVETEKPLIYQMKWICMNCLGTRVTGIKTTL